MKDKIQAIINSLISKQVNDSIDLFEAKLLDSISLVDLALLLEKEFAISIDTNELNDKNFSTVNQITTFIQHEQEND